MLNMTVRQGGLMRCCLASLEAYLEKIEEVPPVETVVNCAYEPPGNGKIILTKDGVWEWAGTKAT